MKTIELAIGNKAIIDDEDFMAVSKYSWTAAKRGRTTYAIAWVGGVRTYLHRFIMECNKGQIIDHKNRNGLDNRKQNLRFVSKSMNSLNVDLKSNNSSGHRGVSWDSRNKKWKARITINGTHHWLGRFEQLEEAVEKYTSTLLIHCPK